jgi:thioredoxin
MKKIILPFATIAFLILSCSQTTSTTSGGGLVDAKQFAAVADSLKDEQIIDVRTPDEYSDGHITDAINIDWRGNDFSTAVEKLNKNKPVMVYCLSGGRSSQAAEFLKKDGFKNVYELDKGILAWKGEGLPVTQTATTKAAGNEIAEVTADAFNTMLNSQAIVLVDFSATWCGPCQRLAPRLEELKNEMAGKFLLVKLDADRDSHLADAMKITALPTLLLYKNGKLIWRNEGLIDKSVIADQITKAGNN